MLDSLKQLVLFFKYSPKRCRRLEASVDEFNMDKEEAEVITKKKFSLFCETRWVEKHNTLQDFNRMYEPLINCLEAISVVERNSQHGNTCAKCSVGC